MRGLPVLFIIIKLIFQFSSSWAFSAVAALEGAFFKKNGRSVVLSEQNLVDCAGSAFGNFGCNGGWPFRAYNYIISNRGIATSSSYPVSFLFLLN